MSESKKVLSTNDLKFFSSYELKTIAIICMIIQHIMYSGLIQDIYNIPYNIGTITLPIIIFLLVEGFIYTKNRHKYFLRLIIAMLISEAPYRLIFPIINQENFYFGNIMATLALIFVGLVLFEKVQNSVILISISFILVLILSNVLQVDAGAYAMFLAFTFFFFRDKLSVKLIIFYLVYITRYSNFLIGLVISIVISMYNGKLTNKTENSLSKNKIMNIVII